MAALHPQIVHFTIVLVIIGVALRVLSLFGRPAFASPAAATLLILAAGAAVLSVRSGTAAHGPVERVPGSRAAVVAHEEWAERTQVILLLLGAIELIGVVVPVRSPRARVIHLAAAAVGLAGAYAVYQTGERGGALVYSYAGGVGLRSGDPQDIERLLLAGYYHQAQIDRQAGHHAQAAALIDAAAARFASDPEVRLLAAESTLVDRNDSEGAITALATIEIPESSRPLQIRRAMLLADAFEAGGHTDQAITALQPIVAAAPNARVQQRIDALRKKATASR